MGYTSERLKIIWKIQEMVSSKKTLDENEFIQKLAQAGDRKPRETIQKAIKEEECFALVQIIWQEGGSLEDGEQKAEAELGKPLPFYFQKRLKNEFDHLKKAKERGKKNRELEKELKENPTFKTKFQPVEANVPDLKVKGETPMILHPNSLSSLTPSSEWWIFVDETGKYFDEEMLATSKESEKGRFAAVFMTNEARLPLLLRWHAKDEDIKDIQKVTQDLLSAKNCGVLGISLASTSVIHGDQWIHGIEMLFEMAIRLLPIEGQTHLNLNVEQRKYTPKDSPLLQLICESAIKRYTRFDPKKAELLTVDAKIIRKEDNPYLAYADAVAMTWNGPTVTAILKDSQWKGTCLLETNVEPLLEALSGSPTPEMWDTLVSSPEAESENSFVSAILKTLGDKVRNDVEQWQNYMDLALKELESKRIKLKKVGAQIDWLKRYCPDKIQIVPRLELIWLAIQLANANHHGSVMNKPEDLANFERLQELVLPEDAKLACFAALHLSVTFTNDFRFEKSREILEKWAKYDPLIIGRNYVGRLESSFGQIEAFEENKEAALERFRHAIAIFNELTDPQEAKSECSQTRAYLITTLMDCALHDASYRPELRDELGRYFPYPLNEMAEQFAVSNDEKEKYQHCLFLRLLAQDPSEEFESACQKYLSLRSEWKADSGHPWELIEFYRGFLFSDPADRLDCFRKAYELVRNELGVLRVIGAVILGSILTLDPSVLDEYKKLVGELYEEFPHEAARIAILESQPTEQLFPLDLAERVLPFNFR